MDDDARPGGSRDREGSSPAWRSTARTIAHGELRGVRRFETPDELPADVRAQLLRMLHVQGSSELVSVLHFRPWLNRAPTIEDRWTVGRIVADEMRHGLEICRLLRPFGDDGQAIVDDIMVAVPGQAKLGAFNEELSTWADVAALLCLCDRVGYVQLENFATSSYAPLARIMPTMLQEEVLHVNFGTAALTRMIRNPDQAGGNADDAAAALTRWLPRALDMFGHSRSASDEMAQAAGLKRWSNDEARARFTSQVERVYDQLGMPVPDVSAERRIP